MEAFRNQGNMLRTTDWSLWLIDRTRAFRREAELRQPELLTRIMRDLLANLRGLTLQALEEATGPRSPGRSGRASWPAGTC